MQKGIAIIEQTENKSKAVFFDHETIEFARLNARTKKRLSKAAQKKQQDMCKAEQEYKSRRKAEKAEARRKAYTVKTVKSVLFYGGICGAVTWAGTAGLIHPIIYVPVSLFCLSAACLHLGAWFGRERK